MFEILVGREYPDVLIEAVKNAKDSIKILVFDWRWYESDFGSLVQNFNRELIRAGNRGVDISARIDRGMSNKFSDICKIDLKRISFSGKMHTKMVIIDDKILFIGSHNLTKSAFEINHEVTVMIEDDKAIVRCNNLYKSVCLLSV
jgi:phosphatidylserine/phosphatidylglycerophosphate/cardiolipin synthase-like enzyme